eukprot:scaffold8511_cov57-Phaeocystis_antarctica.AAC.1
MSPTVNRPIGGCARGGTPQDVTVDVVRIHALCKAGELRLHDVLVEGAGEIDQVGACGSGSGSGSGSASASASGLVRVRLRVRVAGRFRVGWRALHRWRAGRGK